VTVRLERPQEYPDEVNAMNDAGHFSYDELVAVDDDDSRSRENWRFELLIEVDQLRGSIESGDEDRRLLDEERSREDSKGSDHFVTLNDGTFSCRLQTPEILVSSCQRRLCRRKSELST
jgi:hypothetical protein